jgi:hypothetical protein
VVALLQIPAAPRFATADEVDLYCEAFDPGGLRSSLLPLLSVAAVIGLVMVVVTSAPF